MLEVSDIILSRYDGLESYLQANIQATSWAQKALDVVIDTRQSHKGGIKHDFVYWEIAYRLALMRKVSVFRISLFIYFSFIY